MSAEPSPAPRPDPAEGLPPVVAPSGRFIIQLFLVPGLIVAGAVVILLGFSWLAGGPRTPEAFLRDLQSSNPDVRWRTASDLAQVLKRDDRLATDPQFGLQLAVTLQQTVADTAAAERATRMTSEPGAERKAAQARRSYLQYLSACVGNLALPVGAPVLCDMARKSASTDPKTDALLRRQAVWALASLGDNLQRCRNLLPERRAAIIGELRHEANRLNGEPAEWAKESADYLENGPNGRPLGVIATLAECAKSDDPFLRRVTALALTFWEGTPEENKQAEATLVKLARDAGQGTSIEIGEGD
jgi:hypothetical protein